MLDDVSERLADDEMGSSLQSRGKALDGHFYAHRQGHPRDERRDSALEPAVGERRGQKLVRGELRVNEPLLGAVMQIALGPPSALISGSNDPRIIASRATRSK
jgi:hypothetical protein